MTFILKNRVSKSKLSIRGLKVLLQPNFFILVTCKDLDRIENLNIISQILNSIIDSIEFPNTSRGIPSSVFERVGRFFFDNRHMFNAPKLVLSQRMIKDNYFNCNDLE